MWELFDLTGQGRLQLEELILAFVLSALVGLEREVRQKAAGLRTNTLVGVSAALFMLISKYGFLNVLEAGRVVVDPSRVAAQIVSGIGFIGGGVIFMRRDAVKGLTTAASVWLTAALGMACGAGLPVLAIATTIGHFIIMLAFPKLIALLPDERRTANLRIVYTEGGDRLQAILVACTAMRFSIDHFDVERGSGLRPHEVTPGRASREGGSLDPRPGLVALTIHVIGKRPVGHLIARLSEIEGIERVGSSGHDGDLE